MYVERARKVLQHEQRTNHQDQAIKPGGMEVFIAHWTNEASILCKNAGLDMTPIQRFSEHFAGYHAQDPRQRASNLRAALTILNELDVGEPTRPASEPKRAQAPLRSEPPARAVAPAAEAKTSPLSTRAAPARRSTAVSHKAAPERAAPAPGESANKAQKQQVENPIPLETGMSPGHTTLTLLSADVTAIKGVGPTLATRLHHLGIRTIRDLLFYFPREHRDYSKLEKIANLPFNELVTTMGLIWEVSTRRTSGGRTITVATISDETGKLNVSWFNQSYLQKQLLAAKGSYLVVTGMKQRFGNKVEFSVRSHELPEQGDLVNTGRLVPVYALTEGLSAKALRRITKWAVDQHAARVPEYLPGSIRSAGQLLTLPEAIAQIHYPENEKMRLAARRRLAFDELFLIQLGMQERRMRWQYEAPQGNAFSIDASKIFMQPPAEFALEHAAEPEPETMMPAPTLWSVSTSKKPFEATLPFAFTQAQQRVICEICADLAKSRPMSRLLQGDVGAGKTAVAAAALFVATLNGYQGAIMAPTELLAEQHARSISAMLEPFGIQTVLLTGSMRARERAMGRAALENGQAAVAIGTHALIQEDVNFYKLGLVIIDEQHRFGVEQRDALRQKGYHPHMLVMTATPIPRTLALTLYGDLDISIIDQLPPGRQKIITRWRSGPRRNESYQTIAQQIEEGRQAFIICPLIEESETLEAKAATSEYERLQREVFPQYRVGLLHGAMKAAEKDLTMRRFRDQELDVLVATSVIEVGIDIPNATVIAIEDADRFGLSQLHQFRGRVGRGKHQSFCYVLSADAGQQAQERLGVFQETDDGFRLAEEDLRLRGPGDFIGVRQSGMPELRMADLSDTVLIDLTRNLAARLWASDPYLRKQEHAPLRERMHLFWQNYMVH
ncbi:ATP-dependent DNA helicase RecG [Ktedonosporobacter rubrisoli]|nr:ATP-dependent DNA helicase RecG [Ktedonosporobacter rubrisoli]